MADPSDSRAVEDIEQYTKKVLQTFLAPNSAIGIAIKKYIPWSFKDLISPQNTLKLTAVTATVALVLIAVTIVQYNNDRLRTLYGTKQDKRDVVSYQNYELILDFHKFGEKSGKVSLLGHGAHAQGSYSITFNDTGSLEQFINRKHNDFSEAQRTWLSWAMDNQTAR